MPTYRGTCMPKFSILAACLAIALSGAAHASDEAVSAEPAAKPAEEAKVCQRITEVGSRSSRKVCQTKAQWRAERELGKRDVADRDRDER